MAIATAPIALDEPQLACEPIAVAHPAHRWGPPIWPADAPIAALDRPSPAQLDLNALSIILAHSHE